MANGHLNLTRDQLAAFLKDHQSIKQFELLFSTVDAIAPDFANEVFIAAENAGSRAQEALDSLNRLASALELLALAPAPIALKDDILSEPCIELPTQDSLLPPYVPPPVEIAYGSFYATNITLAVVVAAANTAYEVASSMTTGTDLRLMTFGGAHYLQLERDGVYLIVWSMSIDTAIATDQIEGGFMIDGVASNIGTSHTSVPAAGNASAIAASAVVTLAALNQISLYVRNHSAARDIEVQHAALTVTLLRR